MENKDMGFNLEEQVTFILGKFREQGDFLQLDGFDLEKACTAAQEAEISYLTALGDEVYDDDAAFEKVRAAVAAAVPDFTMYVQRFAEDYLDYSEEYLESAGLIDWE